MIGSIHHIGIAVDNLNIAKEQYEALGYRAFHEGILIDQDRRIRVVFMIKDGIKLELISPLDEKQPSPVDRYLKLRIGYAMYHIAYNVEDIESTIIYLRGKGYSQIEDVSISELIDGRREVYMYSRKLGLLELLEE